LQYVWVEDLGQLEDLDIYGNLLRIFGLRIEATLADVARILKDLVTLNSTLLNLYVAYVLARDGYSYEPLASDEDLKLHTASFRTDDWVKNWASFSRESEESWTSTFQNDKKGKLTIQCLNIQLKGQTDSHRIGTPLSVWFGISEANTAQLAKDLKEGRADYVVVHPAICKLAKDAFRETKSEVERSCARDVFLSAGEFRSQIVGHQNLPEVEEGWTQLFRTLESEFLKAWPLLALSENREILRRAEEELHQASREFENANETNCVRDAGFACESLLAVIFQSRGGRKSGSGKKLTFDDFLTSMSKEIEEDFGKHTLQDLILIRDMRNKQVHPGAARPSREDAFRVLRRTQMFFDHFKLNELSRSSPQVSRTAGVFGRTPEDKTQRS